MGHLETILEVSWERPESVLTRLGRVLARLGPSWERLWTVLGGLESLLDPVLDRLGGQDGKMRGATRFLVPTWHHFCIDFSLFLYVLSCLVLSCLSSSKSFLIKWCFASVKHHFFMICLKALIVLKALKVRSGQVRSVMSIKSSLYARKNTGNSGTEARSGQGGVCPP